MVAVASSLTIAEFESLHGKSDCGFEYWKGEAIQKGMPTYLHGLLVVILGELLKSAGYKPGADVELRIAPDARPRPDVIATRGKFERQYPTKGVEVAVEILSPDDSMGYMLQKCASYFEWGFEFIYVLDPESRTLHRWVGKGLEITDQFVSMDVARIWGALDELIGEP